MGADDDLHKLWIQQTAGGDRSAFEQLFRAYEKRIFGFLFRMLSNIETAEELTSDVMVEVWKSAPRFRGESRVSTWMFGIARFKALSALRRHESEAVALEDVSEPSDPHETADMGLLRQSTSDQIQRALRTLSPDHRAVIELTFYEEFSYPEIAAILRCPINTVKTRMFHARKRLRDVLSREMAP
jgi:RNA polymerase sigma-70 factor (ECF subfamily)